MTEITNEKAFSMEVRIENFPNLREQISEVETHHGMKWYTVATRIRENWTITLFCVPEVPKHRITNSFRFKAYAEGFNISLLKVQETSDEMNFNHTIRGCMIGNSVTIKFDVLLSTSVIPPKFDFSVHSDELKSDVVFLVDDREFHASRPLLSIFSPVFSTMFSEKYKESTCSRIPLEDVDADAFQMLLEVLYHKSDVTWENAQEILHLVDYFDVKDIKNKCEQVLVECSDEKLPMKEKLLLADKYMLQELMKNCMENINSVVQLQEVTPEDVNVLNPQTIAKLLQKLVDLRNK